MVKLSRRGVVRLVASSVGCFSSVRSHSIYQTADLAAEVRSLPAPALIERDITPELYGAGKGVAAIDTAAWNHAIVAAGAKGRPVIARGTYVLAVRPEHRWYWGQRESAPVRIAVNLINGTTIDGAGATILVGEPLGQAPTQDERHLIFGTERNEIVGTLKNIGIYGLSFDFRQEYAVLHPYTYAVGIVGVDGFVRDGCHYVSTGTRGGRCLLSENVANREDREIVHRNITQGTFSRYENNVKMTGIQFDGFEEGLDFDGPCWDVKLSKLRFRNGSGEAQCIDSGGGARWLIEDISADSTGSVIFIYLKPSSWPTYGEWMNNAGRSTVEHVIPEHFKVRNVCARRAGLARRYTEIARIGSLRTHRSIRKLGSLPRRPSNIIFENWRVLDGGHIAVHDCDNVRLQDIDLIGTQAGPAALVIDAGLRKLGGRVTGVIQDVRLDHPKVTPLIIRNDAEITQLNVKTTE